MNWRDDIPRLRAEYDTDVMAYRRVWRVLSEWERVKVRFYLGLSRAGIWFLAWLDRRTR